MARSGSTEWRSTLASALRVPDVSTSKWVKMGAVSVRGDPTQAVIRTVTECGQMRWGLRESWIL